MADEIVQTIDSLLDNLVGVANNAVKVNADLRQKVSDLQAQVEKHKNDGSLTDDQLKKIQDVTTLLSSVVS